MKTPYAIIIMDGYGINKDTNGNAVYADGSKNVTYQEKKNLQMMKSSYLHIL